MTELSIFVDESGDFGEYEKHAPYYIITLVMHNQAYDIEEELEHLESELSALGYPNHCVHTGPIIRGEQEYRYVDISVRQKIMKRMMTFTRNVNVRYKSCYIEKRKTNDSLEGSFLCRTEAVTIPAFDIRHCSLSTCLSNRKQDRSTAG